MTLHAITADEDLPLDWSEFPPKRLVQCGTPERLRNLYRVQRSVPGYRSLIKSNVTIFGTVDGELESKLSSHGVICCLMGAYLLMPCVLLVCCCFLLF